MWPLLQCENNEYHVTRVCIYSLMYPACNAHAPYCHVWPTVIHNIFPHYLTNGTIFEKKKSYWTQNVCFEFLYNFCPKHLPFKGKLREMWSEKYTDLHVKYPFFLSDFNEAWLFSADFRKITNIKFLENPSSGNRVVPCVQTDWWRGMSKLTFAFRNFVNALEKETM
jgi:hypothetical protein